MKRVFILKGLDCPNCSAKIEKEVGALPGVESSVVNLMQQTLTVQSEKSADATLAEQVETIVHSHELLLVDWLSISRKNRLCDRVVGITLCLCSILQYLLFLVSGCRNDICDLKNTLC